jgi:plastocyanin
MNKHLPSSSLKHILPIFFGIFLMIVSNANATIHTIQVIDGGFIPASLNVTVGDTVKFEYAAGGFHTTTCDPVALPGTSHPAGAADWDMIMDSPGDELIYPVTRAGTYIYGCIPHWPGMAGQFTAVLGYKLWVGTGGGGDGISWGDPLNWLDGAVPSTTDSVLLNNSLVTSTYIVTLPDGAVNTIVGTVTIQPTEPNNIWLILTAGNTANPGFTVGNGTGSSYDFTLHKGAVFSNISGAAAGTGIITANSVDSVLLLDSALWIHNCTRGVSGVIQKFSKLESTKKGIFRYDVPTTNTFSITASNITYGTLQLFSNASGSSKRYLRTGGNPLTIRGDFYIQENTTDSSGMTGAVNIGGDLSIWGRMALSGSATQQINLNGTTLQTLTGTLSTFISRSVNFNNSAGFNIKNAFYVDSVIMTAGNINSDPNCWLGVGYDAANAGFLSRTGGIVTGQIERWYLAGTTSAVLDFPVGTSLELKMGTCQFGTAPSVAGRIGMRFVDGTDGSDLPIALDDAGFSVTRRSNAYWNLTGTSLVGGTVNLTFNNPSQSGITDPANLRVVWSNDGLAFSMQGSHVAGSGTTARRDGVGNFFSRFYMGGNLLINPLPVELASFSSSIIKNEVILDWVTASELNNAGFSVERSSDEKNTYESIAFISSKGNSNTPQSYSHIDKNLQQGTYKYRLKQMDVNGNFKYFNLANEIIIGIPGEFALSQNYPNPFNPVTNIDYDLPVDGKVNLKIYDISGREVANLVNEVQTAGYYTVAFNANNLASGVYFYRLISGNFNQTKKLVLLK